MHAVCETSHYACRCIECYLSKFLYLFIKVPFYREYYRETLGVELVCRDFDVAVAFWETKAMMQLVVLLAVVFVWQAGIFLALDYCFVVLASSYKRNFFYGFAEV